MYSPTYRLLKTLAVTILFVVACGIFLVACGGGNGNGMPDPERTEPERTEPEEDMRITPPREYGSLAFGISRNSAQEQTGWDVTRTGTSRSAARDAALAVCRTPLNEGQTISGCREVLWFRNACGSIAANAIVYPHPRIFGVGWGASESVAEQKAIAACSAAGGKDCAIRTSQDSEGNSSNRTVCAKAGSAAPSGEASMIPPLPSSPEDPEQPTPLREYGSMAFSMNPWGWSGGFGSISPTAARDGAVAACERACSDCGTCREVLSFRNACGGLAESPDRTRAGAGWGTSATLAGERAVAACHAAGGRECSVAYSSGAPATFCVQAGTATPSGQASPIPDRAPVERYGSIAFSSVNPNWGAAGSFRSISPTAARDGAVAACESKCSNCGTCQEVLSFENACGALAESPDNTRAGAGWGKSATDAGENAVRACNWGTGSRETRREDCRVAIADNGAPFTFCAEGSTLDLRIGQARSIPDRAATGGGGEPGGGGTPTPTPSSLDWDVVDSCNDGRDVEYRFFSRARNVRWPANGGFWVTRGYNVTVDNPPLSCSPGERISIGARIQGTTYVSGTGPDGNRSCSECVYTCGANTTPYRFGCPSP